MAQENRPDPDALLQAIEKEGQQEARAKLRIFLGMSAGVGKTYAMLKAAHQKKMEKVDVVIGVVETHGRSETAALLQGLELIPRKKISYRGVEMEEMDLDEILRRRPELVIVDELAHTNVPGSRHEKRYQDVQELLAAGIAVYTALNVQHLESRKDAVEAITGVVIRETVPDSILERAHLVELVDIGPSELLKRLREGKVYLGEKAQEAARQFFKEDKLTALREIALRMTAERVDQDLQRFTTSQHKGPWRTNERLLVAISHSPSSEILIRAARRIAYSLEAPWVALHINTGLHLNDEDQAQLTKNLNLARELNAEVLTTTDTNVSSALNRICRQKNVTQIIVGRPTKRKMQDFIFGGSILDHLVQESHEVDIHILRQDHLPKYRAPVLGAFYLDLNFTSFLQFWNTFWFMMMVTAVGVVLHPLLEYRAVGFIFLLGVLVVGVFGSLSSVLFAATLSALIWDFGFIPPAWNFTISRPEDIILCISYFVVALITGLMTNRIRLHERLMREREERTDTLYQILKDISESQDKKEFIVKVTDRIGKLLQGECRVVLKSSEGILDAEVASGGMPLSEKESAVAQWVFQNQKTAGWSTETLSQAKALYLPLRGAQECVGVFLYIPQRKIKKLKAEQEALLQSTVGQLGVSIERHFLSRSLQETQRLKDSEALHQTLLNSISHEMRTPLTAILGAAAALESDLIKDPQVKEISEGLSDAGDRLNRVIENLLDMSRLNSGVLALKLEWQDLSDVIGVVLQKLKRTLVDRKIRVEIAPNIGLLRADFRLFEHAISNLILNSTQYAPDSPEILIRAWREQEHVFIAIEDRGSGIEEESRLKIFEKFYRAPGSPPGGTGLGLSIVKNIVELHKGQIVYEDNAPGARFVIRLPHETQPPLPEEVL